MQYLRQGDRVLRESSGLYVMHLPEHA